MAEATRTIQRVSARMRIIRATAKAKAARYSVETLAAAYKDEDFTNAAQAIDNLGAAVPAWSGTTYTQSYNLAQDSAQFRSFFKLGDKVKDADPYTIQHLYRQSCVDGFHFGSQAFYKKARESNYWFVIRQALGSYQSLRRIGLTRETVLSLRDFATSMKAVDAAANAIYDAFLQTVLTPTNYLVPSMQGPISTLLEKLESLDRSLTVVRGYATERLQQATRIERGQTTYVRACFDGEVLTEEDACSSGS